MPLPKRHTLLQCTEDLYCQVAALMPSWPTFAPARGILAPAPGTAARAADHHPEMTLHPPSAGTIASTELRRKSVLSPAPTK
jgi:hypothetical protein